MHLPSVQVSQSQTFCPGLHAPNKTLFTYICFALIGCKASRLCSCRTSAMLLGKAVWPWLVSIQWMASKCKWNLNHHKLTGVDTKQASFDWSCLTWVKMWPTLCDSKQAGLQFLKDTSLQDTLFRRIQCCGQAMQQQAVHVPYTRHHHSTSTSTQSCSLKHACA